MNKKNSLLIKRMVGIAVLTALVIVLQLLGNNVQFGTVSITLALIPIAMGAILYGPFAGLFLGVVMGAIVLTAPSTIGFLQYNAGLTVLLCLVKTGVAGLVSGYVFKLFAFIAKKKGKKVLFYIIGIVAAALIVPVLNTSIFIAGAATIFSGYNIQLADGTVVEPFKNLSLTIAAVLTTNFLIEFAVSVALSPALVTLVKVLSNNYNLGFTNDFSVFESFKVSDLDVEEVAAE